MTNANISKHVLPPSTYSKGNILICQDTQDFLKKLEKVKNIPKKSLLVTILQSYEKRYLQVIITFINFAFTCTNYFTYNGLCHGYNMCSILCEHLYGNFFKAKNIYPYIKEVSLLYLRYIDDIFMIRKGTKAELMT